MSSQTLDQFVVEIELGNDAMSEPEHVASALRQIARNITETPNGWTSSCPILDANGNVVGAYRTIDGGES